MIGFRYTLSVDGEDQKCGIFSGDYPAALDCLIKRFRRLPVPDYYRKENRTRRTEAWFTPTGVSGFRDELCALTAAIEGATLYEVVKARADIPDEWIVYRDDYQFLVAQPKMLYEVRYHDRANEKPGGVRLGMVVVPLTSPKMQGVDAIHALSEFYLPGAIRPALATTDRRRVYAEEVRSDGRQWEVGTVKGRRPLYDLILFRDLPAHFS